MAIDLLNPRLGVQDILEPNLTAGHLPEARPLANSAAQPAGLDALYSLPTMDQLIDLALTPRSPDEELLRPDVFSRNLRAAYEDLSQSRDPDLRRLVRDDLGPLLEDTALLRTFTGLLMGG